MREMQDAIAGLDRIRARLRLHTALLVVILLAMVGALVQAFR